MNKLVRFLNKTFILCVRVLLIAPKKKKNTCLLLIYALVILVLFLISFYFRFINTYHDLPLGMIIMIVIVDVIEICGCLDILIILYTYRKTHLWQKFYQNVNILNNDEQQCHTIIIAALFFQILLYFYTTIMWQLLFEHDRNNVLLAILRTLTPALQFIYKAVVHTLLTIMILEIKRKLIMAGEQLHSDLVSMDVTVIHTYVYQAIEGGNIFNYLFGYYLLIFYFQWFLFVVINLINVIVIINPEKYDYPANILDNINMFTCNLFLAMFGPCTIACLCDMVAAEADKFVESCYEIEEEFHYNSREYHQLQSLTSILGNEVLQFTAAKFIEIKMSMMLTIMASATTYFLALVQFF
ncbi:hypothetical protein ABEB36_013689 [Hypothenemus hampei]|uniref:Gustatory receptor n=1 Tax=Hypothenemus hampei TaxID=57062 RepID=A0ABD1E7R7_HYPHA